MWKKPESALQCIVELHRQSWKECDDSDETGIPRILDKLAEEMGLNATWSLSQKFYVASAIGLVKCFDFDDTLATDEEVYYMFFEFIP